MNTNHTRFSFRLSLLLPAAMACVALSATACQEKTDVQAVSAQTARTAATAPTAVDPGVASAVASAAAAARAAPPAHGAATEAPPLPPGHDNTLPPGHPPVAGVAPARQVAAEPSKGAIKSGPAGIVAEVVQAGRYTYIRIGSVWSAVPAGHVKVGQDVAVVGAMKMINFVSKATGRTFPEVWFGSLAVAGEPAAAQPGAHKVGQKAAKLGAGAGSAAVKVARAVGAGAMTIAELHAKQASLSGKKVRIQGRVMKFNAGILNRNWLHLQDGSGDSAAKTHDLTVTTSATAKVGEIVTVDGVVGLNRDFGAGYAYPVLVEKAVVTPAGN